MKLFPGDSLQEKEMAISNETGDCDDAHTELFYITYWRINPSFNFRLFGTTPVRLLFCRKLQGKKWG